MGIKTRDGGKGGFGKRDEISNRMVRRSLTVKSVYK